MKREEVWRKRVANKQRKRNAGEGREINKEIYTDGQKRREIDE